MRDMVAKADAFLFAEAYSSFDQPNKHKHLLATYKKLRGFWEENLMGVVWELVPPKKWKEEKEQRLAAIGECQLGKEEVW